MNKYLKLEKIFKYSLTIFTLILIPTYTWYYGPLNFLWFSDVGLFLTVLIVWLNSNLINSMASVGILALELAWCIDFIGDFCRNIKIIDFNIIDGLSDYMFETQYLLFFRLMSLFHVVLPFAWIYYLYKWGYNRKGLIYFVPLYWVDLTITYLFTDPIKNTNWVFYAQTENLTCITQAQWLLILYFIVPLILFVPMHFLLIKLCKKAD
jgi:hypothetical protein